MDSLQTTDNIALNYIFYDQIERVFEIFTNPEHYLATHQPFMSQLQCTKGKNRFDGKFSEFSCLWKNMNNYFKIISVEDSPHTKVLTWCCTMKEKFEVSYTLIYTFRRVSAEDITFFNFKMIFDTPIPFTQEELKLDKMEKLIIFKNAEKLLKTITFNRHHFGSINIEEPINKIWAVLSDWEDWKTRTPLIGEVVENQFDSNGDLSAVRIELNASLKYTLYVFNRKFDGITGELDLKMRDVSTCPDQDIIIRVYLITEFSTLMTIDHVMHNPVSTRYLENLAKGKNVLFEQLRDSFLKK
jgi:hypothetical protein